MIQTAHGWALHYGFLIMPTWWTLLSWFLLGLFVVLATVWVMQRSRKERGR